jgi:hypothetical protein
MSDREPGKLIPDDDPVAAELRLAVRGGDLEAIRRLLGADPALATARLGSQESGTGRRCILSPTGPAISPTARRLPGC